jgi:hypothetical protein
MADFNEAWQRHRSGLRPIGNLLHHDRAEHWIRFHSLPLSKRFADTQSEQQILLARQNVLAAEVLGEAPCWLVQSQWVTPPTTIDVADSLDKFRVSREYGLHHAFQFMAEETLWNVHAGLTHWADRQFDTLLLEIADEQVAPTLWMSSANGAIFAPYDGGVDLFLSDQSMVGSLKEAHPDWLPRSPTWL